MSIQRLRLPKNIKKHEIRNNTQDIAKYTNREVIISSFINKRKINNAVSV